MRYSANPRRNSGRIVKTMAAITEPVRLPNPHKTSMIKMSMDLRKPIWLAVGAMYCR
mgnify:CR=1 FL=1